MNLIPASLLAARFDPKVTEERRGIECHDWHDAYGVVDRYVVQECATCGGFQTVYESGHIRKGEPKQTS